MYTANAFTAKSYVAPGVLWVMGVVSSGELTTMSGKRDLDAYVCWLGEVSYVAGEWGILRHLATWAGKYNQVWRYVGTFGYVGCLLKSGVKMCTWEVNEVLHYVGWQVT